MGNPIKFTELVSPDVKPNLDLLIVQFKKLRKEKLALVKGVKGRVKSEDITGKDAAKNINNFSKSIKSLGTDIKQLSAAEKESIKLKEKLKQIQSNLGIENEKMKKIIADQNRLTKESIILNDKNAGTLQKIQVRNTQLRREREKLNLTTKKGQLRLQEINKELDKNNKVIQKNSDVMKKQRLNVGNYTESIKNAAPTTGVLGIAIKVLTASLGFLGGILKSNTAQTEVNTASKVANTTATKSLTFAQRALNFSIGVGTKALRLFKVVLASTGIGAILLALGGLVALFTSTQRGMDKVSQAGAGLKATFEVLRDRMSQIGEAFTLFFSGEFSEGIDTLTGAFKGLGDEIAEETRIAFELEKQLQKILRVENDLIVVRAATRSEINKLKIISGDILQVTNARLDAARKANVLEENLAKVQIAVQKERLKTILTANNVFLTTEQLNVKIADIRSKSLNLEIKSEQDILGLLDKKLILIGEVGQAESTEEDRKQALEAIAIIFQLEEESFKKRKKLISQISSIIDQDARKRLTIEELRIQALDDKREQAFAREILRFEKEKIDASRIGLDLVKIEEIHLKQLQKLRDKFAEEDKLAKEKAVEIERVKAREAEGIIKEINQVRIQGEIDELERQQDEEFRIIEEAIDKKQKFSFDKVRELINKENELRKQALEDQSEFELSNIQLTTNQRILILEKLHNDLANLENARLDEIKDINEQILEEEQKTGDKLKEIRDFGINAAIDALKRRADAAIQTANTEIQATDKQISKQEQLAAQGLTNSLKFEQEQRAKALLAKIEAEKQKQTAEKISAFWNLVSNSDNVLEAIAKFGIGEAFARTIEALPGFEEGDLTPKKESIIKVSEKGPEFIVKHGPAQQYLPQLRAMNEGTYNNKLVNYIDNSSFIPQNIPVNDMKVQELVSEMQAMRQSFEKNMPKVETYFDTSTREIINVMKFQNRKKIIHYKVPRI